MSKFFKEKDHKLTEPLNSIVAKLDKPEDKWSFLYHYARKALDEEIARFQRIDDKSVKLLSSTSIIITVFLALFKWVVEDSNIDFSIYIYLLSSLVFVAFSFSWYYFFKALKLQLTPRMPLNNSIFDLVKKENMASIHVALYKSCQVATQESFDVIEAKAKQLNYGYKSTSVAALLFVIFVLCISYETVSSKQTVTEPINFKVEITMPSKDDNGQQSSTTNEPDLEVTAPELRYVTNDDKTPVETKDQ